MTTINNHSEYVSLVNTLKVYDYQYFTLNEPSVSDAEYDRLYFLAQDYEQRTGDVLADSPTQTAHAEYANGHRQIARRTPMLSTEKAQTIDKVQKWMTKTTKTITKTKTGSKCLFTVEWKYDGVSCSLIYQDGQLIEASYGKGTEGNDCMALCKQVKSIPNEISAEGRVEVRGEMVVPFANLPNTGYKNCRSAAAGIIADTQTTMAHCLEFYPYYINLENRGDYEELTTTESLLTLSDLGFNWSIIDPIGIDRIADYINGMEKIRSEQTFPTDGLVIKVKDRSQWDSLGQTAHHPKYAIAYKFAAATAETTVTRIDITTGATGKRTPVAYFEPIIINGATYQKASVGSEAKLAELGITVGSRVIVSLRNDVIPHIDSVNENQNENENRESENPCSQENIRESENPCSQENIRISEFPFVERNEIHRGYHAEIELPIREQDTDMSRCYDNDGDDCPDALFPVERMTDAEIAQMSTEAQEIIREQKEIVSEFRAKQTKTEVQTKTKTDSTKTKTKTKTPLQDVEPTADNSAAKKLAIGIAAGVALIGIGVIAFAAIGASAFLLPVIGGTLLKA